jgi:hypothetical protein
MAATVAQILGVIYANATVMVVLDNGRDTAEHARELESRFGPRVAVRLLERTEIEGYFSADVVRGWLETVAGRPVTLAEVEAKLGTGRRKRALRTLAADILGRPYRTVEDGSPSLDP